jgi:hypothetical protein
MEIMMVREEGLPRHWLILSQRLPQPKPTPSRNDKEIVNGLMTQLPPHKTKRLPLLVLNNNLSKFGYKNQQPVKMECHKTLSQWLMRKSRETKNVAGKIMLRRKKLPIPSSHQKHLSKTPSPHIWTWMPVSMSQAAWLPPSTRRPKKLRSVRSTKDYTKPSTKPPPKSMLTAEEVDVVAVRTGATNDLHKSPDSTPLTVDKEAVAIVAANSPKTILPSKFNLTVSVN